VSGRLDWRKTPPLAVAGVVAAALLAVVFHPIVRDGLEIIPDGLKYLIDAENLNRGLGLSLGCAPAVYPDTHWAPGYSVLLALVLRLGLPWHAAAAVIALLCYAVLSMGSFALAYRVTRSVPAALATQLVIGMNPVLLHWGASMQSEPLSWLCVLAAVALLHGLLTKGGAGRALALGVVLGAGMLVRFASGGVLLGAAAAIVLLSPRDEWKSALRKVVLVCAPAVAMTGAWLVRNRLVSGDVVPAAFGAAGVSWQTVGAIVLDWWHVVGVTTVPARAGLLIVVPLAGFAILAGVAWRSWRRRDGSGREAALLYLIALIMAAGYCVGMFLVHSFVTVITLDSRMFSPVVLLIWLALPAAVSALEWRYRNAARGLTAVCACAVIVMGLVEMNVLRGTADPTYAIWKDGKWIQFRADENLTSHCQLGP